MYLRQYTKQTHNTTTFIRFIHSCNIHKQTHTHTHTSFCKNKTKRLRTSLAVLLFVSSRYFIHSL